MNNNVTIQAAYGNMPSNINKHFTEERNSDGNE